MPIDNCSLCTLLPLIHYNHIKARPFPEPKNMNAGSGTTPLHSS